MYAISHSIPFAHRLLIRIVGDEIEIKALDPRLPVPTEFLVGSQQLAVYELSVSCSAIVCTSTWQHV
jgi:hypothetical protein